jgi:peptide methionine sulfoxide reductase MsrB
MNESEIEVYLPEILSKRFPGLIPFFKKYEPKINDLLYFADVETITDIVRQIRELTLARADEMVASGENFLDDPGRPERFLRVAKSVLDQDPSTILSKYENEYSEDDRRNVSVRWLPVILGSQMQKSARGSEGAGTALVWLGRWMRQLYVGKSGTRLAGVVLLRSGYELTENAIIEASPNTLEGSFTPDLVESKTWLCKMLAKGLKGKNAGTIYALGSWYGNIGIFLEQAGVQFDKLVLVEPDEEALMRSKELLDTLNDEGKLILIHQKAEDVVYEKPGVVINTSCNETGPVFLTKLPDNMLCLLQARNNVDDVLISTEDLQEFDELFPLGKTYYTGERELADPETDYTRYMKIGRAGKALSETASTGQGGGSAGSSGGQMVGGPTTYEQEYDMFKRKGPRRIIAMTNEAPTIAAALTKRPIKYIDIGGEELFEAAYDSMITSMKQKFPNQTNMITQQVNWAKQSLKKADRIVWYLRIVQAFISDNLGTDLLGDYKFQSLEQLQTDITHFYGYQYAPIENYVFKSQKVSDVISDLAKFEDQWKKKQNAEKGAEPHPGDYKLLEFGGGYAWWFVDRAYCPDEGRSGSHCGNIAGKTKTKQRILSFRNANNQVLLTFIREPNGSLGEMKAKNNQKPSEKFHPYIVKLLDLDMITGIAPGEGQYAPQANFNMFDLTEQQLNYFLEKKPALVETQVYSTPVELLRAPDSIRNNSRLQQIAISRRPGLAKLFGDVNTENWSQAVTKDPALIVYAPHDMPNFQEKLLVQLKERTGEQLLVAPASISKNFNLLKKIISAGDSSAIGGTSPNLKGYPELCDLAVSKDGYALRYIPKELQTERMCFTAVSNNGYALQYVPKELRTERMCFTAVSNTGQALQYVPEEMQTERMCLAAVSTYGYALQYVPEELRTERMCLAAVSKNGHALSYVPEELRTERMYLAAVSNDGRALQYVPKELRTERMCLAAVSNDGHALSYVPEELRTERMCLAAVSKDGYALKYVPEELRTQRMYLAAVSNDGDALQYVPKELQTTVAKLRKMMRTNNT